jgi:hypothetical protein
VRERPSQELSEATVTLEFKLHYRLSDAYVTPRRLNLPPCHLTVTRATRCGPDSVPSTTTLSGRAPPPRCRDKPDKADAETAALQVVASQRYELRLAAHGAHELCEVTFDRLHLVQLCVAVHVAAIRLTDCTPSLVRTTTAPAPPSPSGSVHACSMSLRRARGTSR